MVMKAGARRNRQFYAPAPRTAGGSPALCCLLSHFLFLQRAMLVHHCLDFCRPDLESAGVDHALEAVGKEEKTIFIHITQVARTEETLAVDLGECLGGLGRVV